MEYSGDYSQLGKEEWHKLMHLLTRALKHASYMDILCVWLTHILQHLP